MAKKNKKVYVSFILDETGSMMSCKQQTILGFNEYLATLRKEPIARDIRFTLTRFNLLKNEVLYKGAKLDEVADLTDESYQPANLTPLYDAIGRTIASLDGVDSSKVLFIIQTDGEENSSREYSRQSIFELIDQKKQKGWTFVFLGADQDAYLASAAIGIPKGNTLSYDSRDTQKTFGGAASASSSYFASESRQTESFFNDGDDG